ncbi:Tocopherol cyclase [Castilleja foliolosa]|uniref:Tocopherol cyclase n=1 Tax=Castilleja foliolosa TaxID=1961234 RepID=A0ABD3E9J7_9LAMI
MLRIFLGVLALTAAGGLKQLPGLSEAFENAALIGVHYHYTWVFYEFVPLDGVLYCEIAAWGHRCISAENEIHELTSQFS